MPYFTPHPRFVFGGAEKFRSLLNKISSTISVNTENSPVFAADNMILIGKICGFLKEERFVNLANKFFKDDALHSSIVWRVHLLASAINSCKDLEGDFIEFGCYDAKVAEFLIEYNNIASLKKSFYLYDIFDNPPTDRGPLHSPELFDNVSKRMSKYDFVRVIPGLLPGTFEDKIPDKIAITIICLGLLLMFLAIAAGIKSKPVINSAPIILIDKSVFRAMRCFSNDNWTIVRVVMMSTTLS